MDESCEVRRSGRCRTRPLEFWNFEKAEDSTCDKIIYNEIELTRCSVFQLFSRSYYQGSQLNCLDVTKKPNPSTRTLKKTTSKSQSSRQPARKLDTSTPENVEKSPAIRNRASSNDASVKAKKTTSKSHRSKKPAGKLELNTENAENSPIRNSTSSNDTGVAGKANPPTGKTAKKTTSRSHNSKQPSRKSDVKIPKNTETSPIIKDPCSLRQSGQKRKLDYLETSEDNTLVNQEDHSPPHKSRRKRGSVSVQKSPGKPRTQSLYNNRDTVSSPRSKKKEEEEGNKKSPRKAAGTSPRLTRRRSRSMGMDQQEMKSRKAVEISKNNNNSSNKSNVITPLQSRSNVCGSFFSDSVGQHSRSNITGRDTTQNATAFEQPSFRNVLSSTAIEVPGPGVFKVPRLLPRKHVPASKITSYSIDPSMVTIPEEEEEECEKPGGQEQMDVEEPKKEKEAGGLGEGEVSEATTTATTTAIAIVSARERGRPRKSHTVLTAPASESHSPRKESQGQENTMQNEGNVRRSSRVRTGRLEFWNFEKVEVERQADGEVKVIHHKQDSTMQIQKRVIDCSSVSISQIGHGITLTDDLLNPDNTAATSNKPGKHSKKSKAGCSLPLHPAVSPKQVRRSIKALSKWSPGSITHKSPTKRRLFSPNLNYFDEPAKEESKMSRISVGDMKVTVVGKMDVNNLRFFILEKKEYRCYVARSLHNKEKTIFNSFLFLERGNIVWHSQAKMTIYVMEGLARMHVISEGQTQHHQLQAQFTVQCPEKSKISVRKDGRCKMLKLYICLVREPAVLESS